MDAPLLILASYLLGSVSFAWLLVTWRGGVDLRAVGSGNLGATNAGRALGRKVAILVYVLDFVKGALPLLAWGWIDGTPPSIAYAAGLAAVAGHCFPVWHRFQGGKGVATASGAFVAASLPVFGIVVLTFGAVVLVTRMISAGSLVAALAAPIAWSVLEAGDHPSGERWIIIACLVALSTLVILRHRGNLARILAGTERRI